MADRTFTSHGVTSSTSRLRNSTCRSTNCWNVCRRVGAESEAPVTSSMQFVASGGLSHTTMSPRYIASGQHASENIMSQVVTCYVLPRAFSSRFSRSAMSSHQYRHCHAMSDSVIFHMVAGHGLMEGIIPDKYVAPKKEAPSLQVVLVSFPFGPKFYWLFRLMS